jgi:hypothetical protein
VFGKLRKKLIFLRQKPALHQSLLDGVTLEADGGRGHDEVGALLLTCDAHLSGAGRIALVFRRIRSSIEPFRENFREV